MLSERVALEADEVGDARRRDAEPLDHGRRRVHLDVGDAAARRHHPDVVADELQGVAVAGHDDRAHAFALRRRGERAEDVVGLVPRLDQVHETEGIDQVGEARPLLREQVRHLRPVRLVVLELLVAEGLLGPVPGDDDARRTVLGDDLEEHLAEPEQGVGREAVGGRDRIGQGEEGAKGEARAVEEIETVGEGVRGHDADSTPRPRTAAGRRRPQRSFLTSRTRVPVGPQAKSMSSAIVRMKWMPRPAGCVGPGAQMGAASIPSPWSPISTATSSA